MFVEGKGNICGQARVVDADTGLMYCHRDTRGDTDQAGPLARQVGLGVEMGMWDEGRVRMNDMAEPFLDTVDHVVILRTPLPVRPFLAIG